VQNRSATSKTYDDSSGDSRERFLNTFKHISNDYQPNRQIQGGGEGTSSRSPAYHSDDKLDAAAHSATGLETTISETTKQSEEDLDNVESQTPLTLILSAVISILDKLGFNDSTEGSNSTDSLNGIFGNSESLAALKMLNSQFGQNGPMPSAEINCELDRLRQFIKNAQVGITSSNNGGNLLDGLGNNPTADVANLDQLLKGIISGVESRMSGCDGVYMRADDCGEKPSDTIVKISGMGAELTNNIRESESIQSAKNSVRPSQSEKGVRTHAIKLTFETVENAKEPASSEKARPDGSGLEVGSDSSSKTDAVGRDSFLNRISSTNNPANRFGDEPVQHNLTNNESSPVSKMINDTLVAKENHMKMDGTLNDETDLKIANIDTATKDKGLLNSQNQTTEKAFEAASFSKPTEVGQDNLRTQTLDQIVKRVVIHVKNGQHEAKIDLKPDFLGHVRMQVTTVNHQVIVKILTEFSIVKDMIENNIHQLKADLQQQGLNVDKLEVSVSHDSDKYEDDRQKADREKGWLRSIDRNSPDNSKIERREQTWDSGLRMAGGSTVDYFA
jgi:flagellar hook-length control protein FliK